jgi:hypothetical protein
VLRRLAVLVLIFASRAECRSRLAPKGTQAEQVLER